MLRPQPLAKPDELVRVFNPVADVFMSIARQGGNRQLRLESRYYCGAPYLYNAPVSASADPMDVIRAFDFAVLAREPYFTRSQLYYDRQGTMLYAYENANTQIWSDQLCTDQEVHMIVERIAADYNIATPGIRIDPALEKYEYDPETHEVLFSAESADTVCSAEIVVHEMAHAVLPDLDVHISHHHPYFAKLVVDMYADYLGYDRHVLYDRGVKFNIFGPLNPYIADDWNALPQPVTISPPPLLTSHQVLPLVLSPPTAVPPGPAIKRA